MDRNELLDGLEKAKCPHCGGTGTVRDAPMSVEVTSYRTKPPTTELRYARPGEACLMCDGRGWSWQEPRAKPNLKIVQ